MYQLWLTDIRAFDDSFLFHLFSAHDKGSSTEALLIRKSFPHLFTSKNVL
jgi:hypothetical protein